MILGKQGFYLENELCSEMKEEEVSPQTVLDLREEVLQRVEAVGKRIKRLASVTVFVAFLLALSYVIEMVYPYVTGSTSETVNLRDPGLVAIEAFLTLLAAVWIYVGTSDYMFVSRLGKSIQVARARERELEKSISA